MLTLVAVVVAVISSMMSSSIVDPANSGGGAGRGDGSSSNNNNNNNRNIESVAGYVSGEYPCDYGNMNGVLYAGSNALYFVSSFLVFDRKVTLFWDDVRKVEKLDHHGIEVVLNDDQRHRFTGVHHPERVWVLLVSLHNDSLIGHRGRQQRHHRRRSGAGPPGLRRRNSDPLFASKTHVLDEGGGGGSPVVSGEGETKWEELGPPAPAAPAARSATDSFIMSTAGLDMGSVEGIAGKLSLQPIPCTHSGVKGKLFCGSGAVYFYGRKFWAWNRQEVLLKWEDVRRIQILDADDSAEKEDGGDDSSDGGAPEACVGIRFVTRDDGEFRFLRMDNADRVWATLVALHNENLTAARRRDRLLSSSSGDGNGAGPRLSSSIRRMNSDPNLAIGGFDLDDDAMSSEYADEERDLLLSAREPTTASPLDVEGGDATDWAKLTEASDYSDLIIDGRKLECTLDKFFELFVRDDAEFSVANFLKSLGDSNLRSSSWEGKGLHSKRTVHYTHKVNAPLAPPEADARKEQTYRRYGDLGLCVWTKTFVEGVPMADCFYVEDRIRVVPKGQDSVAVYMEFGLTFIKSTMFSGIITKTTSSEFRRCLESLANYMAEAAGGKTVVRVEEEGPRVVVATQPPSFSILGLLKEGASLTLLATIVMMQFWIMIEIRGMKHAIADLQQQATGNQASAAACTPAPTSYGAAIDYI